MQGGAMNESKYMVQQGNNPIKHANNKFTPFAHKTIDHTPYVVCLLFLFRLYLLGKTIMTIVDCASGGSKGYKYQHGS
jgi:hypothetical protein